VAKRKTIDGEIDGRLFDANAFANDDALRHRVYHPIDVKAIRRASGLTQEAFASTYGFTIGALRDWEQGRKLPERTARVLLRVIIEAPNAVARAASGS
jgi:putative transcriptional regulator